MNKLSTQDPKLAPKSSNRSWTALVKDRQILSWALYDWGNSAFATTVMAGFFPIFFKQYWSTGNQGIQASLESTAKLGYANSFSSLVLGLSAPLLGALADRANGRKKFLLAFTMLGATSASSLFFVAQGQWIFATILYVMASVGFWGGQNFYDALLSLVSPKADMDHVSGLGYGLGYLGGGVLFAVNVFMTLKPELFGLANAAEAVRVSFFTVGIWWLVFTLPLMFNVQESKGTEEKLNYLRLFKESIKEVAHTFRSLKSHRSAFLFLIGYFFYIDGVNTIIKMAVDYGMSLGFKSESLIVALLLVQFIGFPAAIGFGFLAKWIGARKSLYIAIAVYALVTVAATGLQVEWHFYALAAVIGMVQGGIQALSRSVFGQLVPSERSGEFFGFFNMLGRFSSVLGPLLIAVTSTITSSHRISMLSLLILFAVGAFVLRKVQFPEDDARTDA
ncbi:MAG: MFS transporter [Deltaproteobacteria bacterium]|nr:MFS transporter [Deltaproteobacteria bacterium]